MTFCIIVQMFSCAGVEEAEPSSSSVLFNMVQDGSHKANVVETWSSTWSCSCGMGVARDKFVESCTASIAETERNNKGL